MQGGEWQWMTSTNRHSRSLFAERLSVAEQLGAGIEEFLRIDRLAVDARLVMQVRTG